MTPPPPILASGFVVVAAVDGADHMLLLRNRRRGDWGFPKGHVDDGEDLYAAACRELREETGIDRFQLVPGFEQVLRYDVPRGREAGRPKEVTYFLARVDDAAVVLSDEHDELSWSTPARVEEQLRHPNLRALARGAFAFLRALPPASRP